MPAPRILQAIREMLTAALTSPSLSYYQDQGNQSGYALVTLPATSVVPRSVWELGSDAPPMPYVCFAVHGRGSTSRYVEDRLVRVNFWVVGQTEDQITEVYEAVRSRVNFGDQDAGFFTQDLSRMGSSTDLGAILRELVETDAPAPYFDRVTARWYQAAEYHATAE